MPFKTNRIDLVNKYIDLLLNSEDFIIYPIDAMVPEKAADSRTQYNFNTPDANQLPIGIENNVTLFITNDKRLEKISEIEVLVVKDYL